MYKPSEAGSFAAAKKDNSIRPVFVITVDDPQRVGDPIRAYTMYTVHTKVCIYSRLIHNVSVPSHPIIRPLPRCTRSLLSLSSADTPTSSGFTRHCRSTTQEWLCHLCLTRTRSAGSTTSSFNSGGSRSRSVYRRSRAIPFYRRTQT